MEAQKLTLNDIQSKIENATYLYPGGTLTIAILTLTNGYTVTGESACLNPADFDADLGKKIAYENAEEKVWMLEGYLRKEIAFNGAASMLALAPPEIPTGTANVKIPDVVVAPHDDMVPYLGVKIVNAKPMPRGVYIQLRGWDLPGDEDPADAGYLVEYTDAQRPNVTGFQGYVSWSPADVFMAAYSPLPAPVTDAGNDPTVGGAGAQAPTTSGSTDTGSAPTASPSYTTDAGNVQASQSLADPSNPAPVSGGGTAVVDNPAPAA